MKDRHLLKLKGVKNMLKNTFQANETEKEADVAILTFENN